MAEMDAKKERPGAIVAFGKQLEEKIYKTSEWNVIGICCAAAAAFFLLLTVIFFAIGGTFYNGKIVVTLKYNDKKSVISGLQRVSKPGLRTYAGVADMPRVLGGFGTVILSTNKGIMTGKKAKAANVGGEVLCYVW